MNNGGARITALLQLIRFDAPITQLREKMAAFPWDCEDDLVDLTSKDLAAVLHQFKSGGISSEDIRAWANLIECREDIGMSGAVGQAIFRLANTEIEGELTDLSADEIMSSLERAPDSLGGKACTGKRRQTPWKTKLQ